MPAATCRSSSSFPLSVPYPLLLLRVCLKNRRKPGPSCPGVFPSRQRCPDGKAVPAEEAFQTPEILRFFQNNAYTSLLSYHNFWINQHFFKKFFWFSKILFDIARSCVMIEAEEKITCVFLTC